MTILMIGRMTGAFGADDVAPGVWSSENYVFQMTVDTLQPGSSQNTNHSGQKTLTFTAIAARLLSIGGLGIIAFIGFWLGIGWC
jgi:hypothetical protein